VIRYTIVSVFYKAKCYQVDFNTTVIFLPGKIHNEIDLTLNTFHLSSKESAFWRACLYSFLRHWRLPSKGRLDLGTVYPFSASDLSSFRVFVCLIFVFNVFRIFAFEIVPLCVSRQNTNNYGLIGFLFSILLKNVLIKVIVACITQIERSMLNISFEFIWNWHLQINDFKFGKGKYVFIRGYIKVCIQLI